jgi:hypothetical protein
MDFKEFLSFKKQCIYCNKNTAITMNGSLKETIGDYNIAAMFSYDTLISRKDFITFAFTAVAPFSFYELYDIETLNINKYNSFQIKSDGYATFDYDFSYKMKFSFQAKCPDSHYCYSSRIIKISDKSSNITKGYDVMNETFKTNKYIIMSDKKEDKTIIFDINMLSKEPSEIPYIKISSFPTDDFDKCDAKIENILLLK